MAGEAYSAGKGTSDRVKAMQELNPRPTGTSASAPAKKSGPPAKMDLVNKGKKASYGSRPGEKRIDVKDMVKPLGSFHKGGKVKKTGAYRLKKGERVLTGKQLQKLGRIAPRKVHAPVKRARKRGRGKRG